MNQSTHQPTFQLISCDTLSLSAERRMDETSNHTDHASKTVLSMNFLLASTGEADQLAFLVDCRAENELFTVDVRLGVAFVGDNFDWNEADEENRRAVVEGFVAPVVTPYFRSLAQTCAGMLGAPATTIPIIDFTDGAMIEHGI